MFSIVSGVFITSRMSSALDFSCAGCLQWAPSSSVHSPQMSHKSTLRMRTNPCQVYSTNLILSVHPPQIRHPPTTCPVEPTQIVGPPISHTHISMLRIEKLLSISNDVYPQARRAFWLLDTSHNWIHNFLNLAQAILDGSPPSSCSWNFEYIWGNLESLIFKLKSFVWNFKSLLSNLESLIWNLKSFI